MRKNIVVITGGPGFGKTSLIEALAECGFSIGEESARNIIGEQLTKGGDVLPWKNVKAFQNAVLACRIKFWQSVQSGEWAFSDRGIPDQLAFAAFRGFKPSSFLIRQAQDHQYFSVVFICPPWEEIYTNDAVRAESFEEAYRLHAEICSVYESLGYRLINLPKLSVASRVEFILEHLQIESRIETKK